MKPVYLYVKKHNVTGLLYFGRTINPDPSKYLGSGQHWRAHLNTHGKDISTIFFEKFDSLEDAKEFATFFSEEFDIVKSEKWANLIIEDGTHTGSNKGVPMSSKQKQKMRLVNIGKKHSEETKLKMSIAHRGKTRAKAVMIKYSCVFCHREMVTAKMSFHRCCKDTLIEKKTYNKLK